jgi:hypothetical protein
MNGISRETFAVLSPDQQTLVIFDLISNTYECTCKNEQRLSDVEKKIGGYAEKFAPLSRVVSLEKKVLWYKRADTGVAGTMGLIGGFMAHFLERVFKG